jgi:peptidyl-prolyl cis-trans isomerase D
MMQAMRENTKWIMLAVAVAFVALMVFEWGMDMTGQSGAQMSGGEIGRVNGDVISYEEYNSAYRSLYDQQSQLASGPIGPALTREIEDATFEQIVMQKLIEQELRRRGIVVTDAEVQQAARFDPPPGVRSNPAFMTDGQFDLEKYHAYMSSPAVPAADLLSLEMYYRSVIPQTKLYFQQTSGIYVADEQLWRMWRDTRDSVMVRYVAFDPQARIPDEGVSVSEAEIATFYDEHRDDFIRPARGSVKFVVIDSRPNVADTAASLARAQRIRAEIVGGADFAEIALIESADTQPAEEGGLVTVQRGQTNPAIDQAVFSLPTGTISEPVQSDFGYHIIRVESRTDDEAEFRHIMIPIELSFEHENELFAVADSIDVLSETHTLDAIGRLLDLEVQQADLLPGLAFLPGVGQVEDGADWAFNTGEPGEVSEVFESPGSFYALELVSREDERTQTIDEARETIRTALVNRKKVERTMQIARDAVDRIRAGESFQQVVGSVDAEVREAGPFARSDVVPGLGRMNAAIGTAFGLQPGEISGAIDADQQVYIIQTVSRVDASREAWEEQKAQQRQQVSQALAQQRWENFLTALREEARVVDNRAELARQTAAQQAALN